MCISKYHIRAQALTLTKAHEEWAGPLMGIAQFLKRYGYDEPSIAYSNDPVKVSRWAFDWFEILMNKI